MFTHKPTFGKLDMTKPLFWLGVGSIALCSGLSTLGGCRKPAPDEIVNGTQQAGPTPTNTPTTGGSGGASWSFGGSGGEGGTSADSGVEVASCGFSAPAPTPFSKANLLSAIAECAIERYSVFHTESLALSSVTDELASDPSSENFTRARLAWQRAIGAWQEAEVFRFGPTARPAEPGGQDFRDQIYGWPLVSRCKVEEQIVDQAYLKADFGKTSFINGRTLASLDYLLFYSGTDNSCSNFSAINAKGTWAELSADEITTRKASYASAVASAVEELGAQLVQAWQPDQGNFCGQLAGAGTNQSIFATDQAALNAISDGMFYIEKELKDWKLARPLGYSECYTATCPEAVELPYSRGSTAHLKANLRGFKRVFQGCGADGAGIGFDDWLVAVGAEDLAERMTQNLAEAQAAVDSLPGALDGAIVNDYAKVEHAYAKVKGVTDLLKTEFVTVLNLDLPKAVEGDND